MDNQLNSFKNSITGTTSIISAGASNTLPGKSLNGTLYKLDDNVSLVMNNYFCDYDFAEALSIEMKDGRFFSKEFATDSSAIVLNETAVKLLGLENPIGKEIFGSFGKGLTFHIIGVVKDFHFESMQQEIKPLAMLGFLKNLKWHPPRYISAKINSSDIVSTINFIQNEWNRFLPNVPFEYSFLNEDYDNIYKREATAGKTITIFSLLAIFVGCLGLFGLASFTAVQRTKEMGIRKVLGASHSNILLLFSKSFLRWIIIANVIAIPAAYFAMHNWLEAFAYRVEIGPGAFIFAGLVSFTITLSTIGYQAVKTANNNPVESLRSE